MDTEKLADDKNITLPNSPPTGWSRYGRDETFLPTTYANWLSQIQDTEVRPDDVWVISFPKCGTTWTQEMVWLLGNDCNFEKAKEIVLYERFPYYEFNAILSTSALVSGPVSSMDRVANMSRTLPRFIKSHLPLNLLPRKFLEVQPKLIYVCRNPKDCCVSYFHHHVLFSGYPGSLEDFTKLFLSNEVRYAPYWPHVKGYQKLSEKNYKNLLLITFEEMKSDLESVIRKTANFLGKDLSAENLNRLLNHLSFDEMKKNPAVNYDDLVQAAVKVHQQPMKTQFLRKGTVGSWRDEMSEDLIKKFDLWNAQHQSEGEDL